MIKINEEKLLKELLIQEKEERNNIKKSKSKFDKINLNLFNIKSEYDKNKQTIVKLNHKKNRNKLNVSSKEDSIEDNIIQIMKNILQSYNI